MARLQKKKTPSDKKSKRTSAPGTDERQAGTAAPAKPVRRREPKKEAAVPSEPNMIQKGITFLREVRVELSKVIWPTRKQAAGSTLVVIILVFILAAFLGLVDITLSKLVQVVLA